MSCGGNAKDNPNRAAIQAAFAPYKGAVAASEGPAVFHRLTREHRTARTAEITGGSGRALTRDESLQVTQEAHAHARANIAREAGGLADAAGAGPTRAASDRAWAVRKAARKTAGAVSRPPLPEGHTYVPTVTGSAHMRPGDVLTEPGYRDTKQSALIGKVVDTVRPGPTGNPVVRFTDGTEHPSRVVFTVDRPYDPAQAVARERYDRLHVASIMNIPLGPEGKQARGGSDDLGPFVDDPDTGERHRLP